MSDEIADCVDQFGQSDLINLMSALSNEHREVLVLCGLLGYDYETAAEILELPLGTIRSRRDDRLLDSIKSRVNQKAYQRGVHKGERIEPSMYFWPDGINPMSGIERQMKAAYVNVNGVNVYQALRNTPQVALLPAPHLVNDGKANTVATSPAEINERRQAMLAYLKPAWR